MHRNEERERPVVKLWRADRVLAALLLRLTRCRWAVSDVDGTDLEVRLSPRPTLLLCGPELLCEVDSVRLLHEVHRSKSAIIVIVGG